MIIRRDDDDQDIVLFDANGNPYRPYRDWTDDAGFIIKWVILGLILFLIVAFFGGGYMHARMRLRKGLPLLGYHRWFMSSSTSRRQQPDLVLMSYHVNNLGQPVGPDGRALVPDRDGMYQEALPEYKATPDNHSPAVPVDTPPYVYQAGPTVPPPPHPAHPPQPSQLQGS